MDIIRMQVVFIALFILLNVSKYQCEIPHCETNCDTNNQCWENAIKYRARDLTDQLFLFSSLSVHLKQFQTFHQEDLNDTISFIDQALENYLREELNAVQLDANLFVETKQSFINLCADLTSSNIGGTEELPPLICGLETCYSKRLNFMVLFIIAAAIMGSIAMTFVIQLSRTVRLKKRTKISPRTLVFVNVNESSAKILVNPERDRF